MNLETKKMIENAKASAGNSKQFLTFEFNPASISRYLKIRGHVTEGKVLDVGCCRGVLYLFLKDKKIQYTGLEKDKKLSNIANKITDKKIIHNNIYKNKLKNNFFDFIILCEVLEHVENPLQLLKECKRLLKKDGKIIGTAPNSVAALSILWALLGKEYGHYDHTQLFSVFELKNLIKFSGLKLKHFETFFFQIIPGYKKDFSFLRRLFPLLGKHLFFIATK